MSQGRQSAAMGTVRLDRPAAARMESDAARKRAAVEMIAEHGPSLRRTARRYSLDAEDADDAYQRALEIALTKAPTTDPRELIRWTHTVTKHEALAVRQGRERLLGSRGLDGDDPVALIPAGGDGPDEEVERREAIARSREALQALKPAELRALTLLAEGYSYAEIGELTGFSRTKINRVLAEGRSRFRDLVSSSEDGSRCRELQPLLSAFCDGETSPSDSATVREHLRACGRCRSTMRAYRAAPRIAIALAPALPPSRSLLGRLQDLIAGLGSRLHGGIGVAGESSAAQIAAAGGSRGAGMAAFAKLLALCAGAAGGAAACVAGGVLPAPYLVPQQSLAPAIERSAGALDADRESGPVRYEPAPISAPKREPQPDPPPPEAEAEATRTEPATAEVVEYEPAPAPAAPTPAPPSGSEGSGSVGGSAAGEFGP